MGSRGGVTSGVSSEPFNVFSGNREVDRWGKEQGKENLERWRFATERGGMEVSRRKTEYMCEGQ